jgi:phosphotransferase system HPr-like phosphotransfer protein
MRKIIISLSFLSALLIAFSAHAEKIKGKVESFDPDSKTIFLAGGEEYILSDNLDVSVTDVEPGTNLTLTFDTKGENRVITAISVNP